jgi:2-oxoisovalerate dehydrogenase E2 component (dihydrolipoyl transacylase)
MNLALPELGEGILEAELIRWLVETGASVEIGTPLLEVMTDKAVIEVPSPSSGKVEELLGKPGDRFKVGETVLRFVTKEEVICSTVIQCAKEPIVAVYPTPVVNSESNGNHQAKMTPQRDRVEALGQGPAAAPSVRRMARKLGVNLENIAGTGPSGRILIDDLTQFLQQQQAKASRRKDAIEGDFPGLDIGRPGTTIPVIGLRRKILERMEHVHATVPQYTMVDECEATQLVQLRQMLKDSCAARGVKLTYLAFFIKAVVAGLKEVPIINSSLNAESDRILLHDHYHIGVAVAAPQGLIVPVVRDADHKSVFEIAREIDRLGKEAKAGRTKLDDLRGSTFTVTSIGNYGGLLATPIVNPPEVGILGVGRIIRRPVFDEKDRVRPAEMVYLSFSFDHRVVDGAIAVMFGNAIIRVLQRPAELLLPETI